MYVNNAQASFLVGNEGQVINYAEVVRPTSRSVRVSPDRESWIPEAKDMEAVPQSGDIQMLGGHRQPARMVI